MKGLLEVNFIGLVLLLVCVGGGIVSFLYGMVVFDVEVGILVLVFFEWSYEVLFVYLLMVSWRLMLVKMWVFIDYLFEMVFEWVKIVLFILLVKFLSLFCLVL